MSFGIMPAYDAVTDVNSAFSGYSAPDEHYEGVEAVQMDRFFRENEPNGLFGFLLNRNGFIEFARGDSLPYLGYNPHQLYGRPLMRFISGPERQQILSMLPSSSSYQSGNIKSIDVTFCNEKTSDVTALTLISKLVEIPVMQQTEYGLQCSEKKCIACIAKKPNDIKNTASPDFPAYGTFMLYLNRESFRVINFDLNSCTAPSLEAKQFLHRALQQLCSPAEWPAIELMLEAATKVEKMSTELTFTVDGRHLVCRVTTVCALAAAKEPIQLICDVLQMQPEQVSRSISLRGDPSAFRHMDLDMKPSLAALNRTFSVPVSQMDPPMSFAPGPVKPGRKGSTSTAASRKSKKAVQKQNTLDSVIDSVVHGPHTTSTLILASSLSSKSSLLPPLKMMKPPLLGSGLELDIKPSVLKSMLENDARSNREHGIPENGLPDPFSMAAYQQSIAAARAADAEYQAGVEPAPVVQPTKKKRIRNPNPKKKQPPKGKSPLDMYQTAGYPSYPPGQPPQQQHYQPPGNDQNHALRPAMFNPNMPSSSRSGPMTSSAAFMQMGHPNMNGGPMMYQQMPMQQHPQMQHMMHQQQQQQGGQWNQQQQHNPNMYTPQQQQQMFYNGQRPPPQNFMQIPPQMMQQPLQQPQPVPAAAPKKGNKRKSAAQRNHEQQQNVTAMLQAQNAATSQQMLQQQPPVKQPFLNHPMFSHGSPQLSNPNTPMPSHLSPYHPNPQQQQQQQHYDWNKQAAAAAASQAAMAAGQNRPNSRSEQVRADLRANIQARQHSSPQQMGAIMSPNEMQQQQRYMTGAPTTSISPPTMMSPPRIPPVSHPGHASQNYGPGSIPQPSSSDPQTNLFSPKNSQYYGGVSNGYPMPMQQHQMSQQQAQNQTQMIKDFPVLTLEDCREILQEADYGDVDFVGFDMMSKPGFEFNFEESLNMIQKMSCP